MYAFEGYMGNKYEVINVGINVCKSVLAGVVHNGRKGPIRNMYIFHLYCMKWEVEKDMG